MYLVQDGLNGSFQTALGRADSQNVTLRLIYKVVEKQVRFLFIFVIYLSIFRCGVWFYSLTLVLLVRTGSA